MNSNKQKKAILLINISTLDHKQNYKELNNTQTVFESQLFQKPNKIKLIQNCTRTMKKKYIKKKNAHYNLNRGETWDTEAASSIPFLSFHWHLIFKQTQKKKKTKLHTHTYKL